MEPVKTGAMRTIYVINGPSGSGKTTRANQLTRRVLEIDHRQSCSERALLRLLGEWVQTGEPIAVVDMDWDDEMTTRFSTLGYTVEQIELTKGAG